MAVPSAQNTVSDEERRITLIGVLLVFLLGALDNTIISTAMPKIASQLNGLNLYAWVTTVYLLTSTVTVPIYGKLGDIYGRKPVLIWGVLIFMTGSALCGLAGELDSLPFVGSGMTQLIIFRAIQGVGGGALFTSAFAIIADLYPARERAKFAGLFGSVFGLASIAGPVIGGFLTDLDVTHVAGMAVAGWRWIFYVNLPISLIALFMIVAKMPDFSKRAPGSIDYLGAALLIATFVPFLLALGSGDGGSADWDRGRIIGLYACSAVALIAFLVTESKVSNPIVPLDLFMNQVFSTTNAVNFAINMAFMGFVTFVPLYMQLGQGVSATVSGLLILPMMVGMILVSTVCGHAVTRTGKYKPFMVGGLALTVVALFALSRIDVNTSTLDLVWRMLLLGVSLGPTLSIFSVIVQNVVPDHRIGIATSSTQFFRQIGGAVGVAVFGALVTHNLAASVSRMPALPGQAATALTLSDLHLLAASSTADRASLDMSSTARDLVVDAIANATLVGVAFAAVAFVLMWFVPSLPLAASRN